MGIISLNNARRLYWLGRYTERVYTGLKQVKGIYDANVDGEEADYETYCRRLGIPCIYKNTADFCKRYFFDTDNPNSIASSLVYAYDNAIVLRDTLSTDTLAYILMSLSAMDKAITSDSKAVELQWVMDDIMAFRGSCEENIFDESARAMLKLGVSQERVDLYLRQGESEQLVRREFERLFNRLYKTQMSPQKESMDLLVSSLLDSNAGNYQPNELITALEGLFPEM